jgi:hypothetical protein
MPIVRAESGAAVSARRIRRGLVSAVFTLAALAGLITVPSQASASPGDLAVLAYPLLAPDPGVDRACSETVLSFTRQDGAAFREGQTIRVQYQFTYNDSYAVSNGRWSDPWKPDSGIHFIKQASGFPGGPTTVAVPFSLCTFQFNSSFVKGVVSRVRIKASLSGGGLNSGSVESDVEVIPWSAGTALVSRLISECKRETLYGGFDGNLLISQKSRPKRVGDRARLAGTLFRSGIVAPNDTVRFYKSDFDLGSADLALNDLGAPVATATTDANGQFEVSLPIGKPDDYRLVTFMAVAPARAEPIGPIPGPFPEEAFPLVFNWAKQGRYETSLKDWIPQQSPACLAAYAAYSAEGAVGPDGSPTNTRPLALYLAGKALAGAKGKKAYTSADNWELTTGGSCRISWWERNGRRVSGYTVTCDRRS